MSIPLWAWSFFWGAVAGLFIGILVALLVAIKYERLIARREKELDAERLQSRALELEILKLSR